MLGRNAIPLDTGRKLSVRKTFRRRPGRLLNVLYTLNLRTVSKGTAHQLQQRLKLSVSLIYRVLFNYFNCDCDFKTAKNNDLCSFRNQTNESFLWKRVAFRVLKEALKMIWLNFIFQEHYRLQSNPLIIDLHLI